MFLIEIGEPFFDFFAHGDGLLEVLVLRLEDVDAIVDDGALLEQLPLLAGRVLGQDRFGAPEDMGSAIDSAESEVSERAGKGLDGRIRVESYFCHIIAWAETHPGNHPRRKPLLPKAEGRSASRPARLRSANTEEFYAFA